MNKTLPHYHIIYFPGSIKIWDLGAGQEIKSREEKVPVHLKGEDVPLIVSGIAYLSHHADHPRCLIAMGWNNVLRIFAVSIHTPFRACYKMANLLRILPRTQSHRLRSRDLGHSL